MNNLKELERQYEELGKEIERLKAREAQVHADRIFLLSAEEYKKYKDNIPHVKCCWWLRSPGSNLSRPTIVDSDGYDFEGCIVNDNYLGVRPVLKIIPDEWLYKFGDRINYCGVTWIKIDENLYITEMPIAFRRFDKYDNDYLKSEIRQFLLDWYEKRKGW